MAGVPERVVEYRWLAYRALVLQNAPLPAVWAGVDDGGTDLMVLAESCGWRGPVRRPCRNREVCLAAALWLDDRRPWVAGYPEHARWELWADFEAFASVLDPWIGRAARSAGIA